MADNSPIGVFDSGVGGLTVAREIMNQIPKESIVYFGDTARVPYGNKSPETVITYCRQITRFLLSKNVKAIVIACNTATAFALETLKQEVNIPIIGVIEPGAFTASYTTHNNRIGVIATVGAINSNMYTKFLNRLNPDIKVFSKACPLFVPLVEEGMIDDPVTFEMIKRYTSVLIDEDIDTLILGCTHYPLLKDNIQKVVGPDITLVNPAYETAKALKQCLLDNNIESNSQTCEHSFFVSDGADKFREFANSILPCDVIEANDICDIERY
ncbi:MAG: glutamate racemase [Lachnospiraceae bacterium]|nr:glutamate racemase [Lachnospiraceae bacterium]